MAISIRSVYVHCREFYGMTESVGLTAQVFNLPRGVICAQLGLDDRFSSPVQQDEPDKIWVTVDKAPTPNLERTIQKALAAHKLVLDTKGWVENPAAPGIHLASFVRTK